MKFYQVVLVTENDRGRETEWRWRMFKNIKKTKAYLKRMRKKCPNDTLRVYRYIETLMDL